MHGCSEPDFYTLGEKPFDTVEDLVQDGLITLYMEANDVEEYLQSARQTRIIRQSSISNADALHMAPLHPAQVPEEPMANGDALSREVEDLSLHGHRARRQAYQPCTIPQRRDCTNVQLHVEGEVHVVEEAELEKPAELARREVRSNMVSASGPPQDMCVCRFPRPGRGR